MNNQIYNFFPLTILKSKIDLDKSIKDLMIKKIFEMEKNSKNLFYKNENSSWTGDTQGYEFLHIISEFDDFFIEVKKKILEYLDIIEINHDLLDIYIQRSWATISRGKENIAQHKHLQSHLSFAYYLKKSPSDAHLLLIDETKHNEFLPGSFLSPTINQKGLIKKRNISNTAAIVIDALEDEIIIFPSKTAHQTQPNVNNNERISLSADIFVSSKNSENLEHLVTPLKDWKLL